MNVLRSPNEDHCAMLRLCRDTEIEICFTPSIAQCLHLQQGVYSADEYL